MSDNPKVIAAIDNFRRALDAIADAAEEAREDVYVSFGDTDYGFTYYVKRDRLTYDRVIDMLAGNQFNEDDREKIKDLLKEYAVRKREDRYSDYKFDVKNWELVQSYYDHEGWTSSSDNC